MGRVRRVLMLAVVLCAITPSAAGAVVGGRPASEPYPWMASLQLEGSHYCGASLLGPDVALTAAHCIEDVRRRDLTLVLGRDDLGTSTGETLRIRGAEAHPEYRTDPAGGFDVAILRLDGRSGAQPLPLVAADRKDLWAPGTAARVVGWGTSVFLVGPAPDDLMEVDVEVIDDGECATSYTAQGFDPETQVCAGRRVIGLADSCQGDSGGPLLVRDDAGAWVQMGVVSQGTGCGLPLFYGVYARVGDDPLHTWITDRIEETSPSPGSGPGAGPATPARSSVDLRFKRKLKRRDGAVLVKVRTSEPVTNVRATLKRRGKVLARGRRSSLERKGKVRMPSSRAGRGRAKLKITAVDGDGLRVKRVGRAKLGR